jgi:hypothetical protein
MAIECNLKQISLQTLEILIKEPLIAEPFMAVQWFPDSAYWKNGNYLDHEVAQSIQRNSDATFYQFFQDRKNRKNYDSEALKKQFLTEWKIDILDLHKYWEE